MKRKFQVRQLKADGTEVQKAEFESLAEALHFALSLELTAGTLEIDVITSRAYEIRALEV